MPQQLNSPQSNKSHIKQPTLLADNRDDQDRHHSYLMDDKGEWHIVPTFDCTFAPEVHRWLNVAVIGEGRDVARRAIRQTLR